MSEPRNIFQRLNDAKKQIKYVQKDKKVESYMAVTHDAVTAATLQILIDNGIIVCPSEQSNDVVQHGQTSKGTPIIRFAGKFDVSFINIDNPEDRLVMAVTAHALDHGDKAPGKALSYATKYAILKALQLETGEDDESRAQTDGVGDDFISAQKIAIDSAESADTLKAVWQDIVKACKESKDTEAYNHLKKLVTERGNKLKEAK